MLIEIGIKRLSLLKEKGLITEEIFSDAEELLIKSEMDIYSKYLNLYKFLLIKNLIYFLDK